MPSGNAHAAMSLLAGGGVYLLLRGIGYTNEIPIAACAGCLAGILITPDLDVDNPVRSHYVVYRRYGALAGIAWRLLWLPYALAIGHRSWVSHFPIVSTLIRVAYLAIIGWGFWRLALVIGPPMRIAVPVIQWPAWWLWALGGLIVSDVLHWAADTLTTKSKRRRCNDGNRD